MTLKRFKHEYQYKKIALIGYGVTGKACARFLANNGAVVTVFDKAFSEQSLPKLQQGMEFSLLSQQSDLTAYDLVVVSPGINLNQHFLSNYRNKKAKMQNTENLIISDIEIFAQALECKNAQGNYTKLIAITGSNGKSTVVDMLVKSLTQTGLKVGLGGNFGNSALELLNEDLDVIVLELSSFQLETTFRLAPDIACILNISSDHLDRHGDMQSYIAAKQKIFTHAKYKIFNRNDTNTYPQASRKSRTNREVSFGLPASSFAYKRKENDAFYFHNANGIYHNESLMLSSKVVPDANDFQLLNMQVVYACAHLLDVNIQQISECLITYKGLSHRYEVVHTSDTTLWINDSKATNPGACVVAIESLHKRAEKIVLIAGGDAKGADLQLLGQTIKQKVCHLILLGKDANAFKDFDKPFVVVDSMQSAVAAANVLAANILRANTELDKSTNTPHKVVEQHSPTDKNLSTKKKLGILLSPACASIDMFTNYQQRGDEFTQAVKKQVAA